MPFRHHRPQGTESGRNAAHPGAAIPSHVNLLILRVDWNYDYQSHPELKDEHPLSKADNYSYWPNPDRLYCKSYCPLHPGVHKIVFELIDELCDWHYERAELSARHLAGE